MVITSEYAKVNAPRVCEGLTGEQARASALAHGKNVLSRKKKKSFMRQFCANLGDPVIKILLGALVINLIFTIRDVDWLETGGIAVSAILATLISTLSEYGSQAAFERLNERGGDDKFRVVRDGVLCALDSSEIVVGDLVSVGAGEQIPADCEVVSGNMRVDQSAMTGENREVKKSPPQGAARAERAPSSPHYCCRGSTVVSGKGYIRVCAVGDSTMLGGISLEVQDETRESPLRVRLRRLAKQISAFGYVIAIAVALIYLFNTFCVDSAFDADIIKYKLTNLAYLREHLFFALTTGLTLLIVAVPEGLPMMIAVVLSSNIKRMVKDSVLVRKPVGIEAAGSMNILFTDKTGTLTEGRLRLREMILGDGTEYKSLSSLAQSPELYRLFCLSALGNTSCEAGVGKNGRICALGGNATDRAILDAILERERRHLHVERLAEIPFDSDRKFSAALLYEGGKRSLLVKGAPERLAPHITHCLNSRGGSERLDPAAFSSLCKGLTRDGKRVLAITRALSPKAPAAQLGGMGALELICLITLEDKIRREAKNSVLKLRRAGIRVVMVTGDNLDTATSIARRCGILGSGVDRALSGDELAALSDAEVRELLPRLGVVARALPSDKSRLVRLSQESELVVGMTGDGINDAPALRKADVGFAMGSGTQVAKDAGDIIILDNDLASIVKAVLYGRNVFKSIRKFITLQLLMNFCAVGVSVICPFVGIDAPVTVVQMLWINLIMDTLGGLAFAGEPALESCMEEMPKRRDEPILNKYMVSEIAVQGSFTVALYLCFLKLPEITSRFRYSSDNIYLLTAFFALFIFTSVFNCFNARTDRLRLFSHIGKNRAFIAIMTAVMFIQILFVYLGGDVLRTAPLIPKELAFTLLLSTAVFPAELLRKLVWRAVVGREGY